MAKELIDDRKLLAEIEDLLRTYPYNELQKMSFVSVSWLGRLSAAISLWDNDTAGREVAKSIEMIEASWIEGTMERYLRLINQKPAKSTSVPIKTNPYSKILIILHKAQSDLRFRTIGPLNQAFEEGQSFQYFDQLRRLIEEAATDILFVDPYLNSEFVSKYLPHVKAGVRVRLLGSNKITALKSAAEECAKQHGFQVLIRSSKELHDRWIFIDGTRCFQSGASFKDGAVRTGTTLTQNVDTFSALKTFYEEKWLNSIVSS
jgi:hypothetical protein